jgi:hypothetical protein
MWPSAHTPVQWAPKVVAAESTRWHRDGLLVTILQWGDRVFSVRYTPRDPVIGYGPGRFFLTRDHAQRAADTSMAITDHQCDQQCSDWIPHPKVV